MSLAEKRHKLLDFWGHFSFGRRHNSVWISSWRLLLLLVLQTGLGFPGGAVFPFHLQCPIHPSAVPALRFKEVSLPQV